MKNRTVFWECSLVTEVKVNGGNDGKGIWLMGFIYIYEIEQ
jgi:hypothetical protein